MSNIISVESYISEVICKETLEIKIADKKRYIILLS